MEYTAPSPSGIWGQIKCNMQRLQEFIDFRWMLLLVAAIIFTLLLTYYHEPEGAEKNSDVLDMLLVSFLGTTVLYSAHRIFTDQCFKSNDESSHRDTSKLKVTFADTHSTRRIRKNSGQRSRKIDPKYFKARFIYTELKTIWDTTYTVISWGSVWIVGGTIMAGGRLAQKVKTKCTKETPSNNNNNYSNNFDLYHDEDDQPQRQTFSTDPSGNNVNSPKSPYRRISSWTKKSCSTIKKRFNRATNPGVLRIEDGTE